MSTDVQEETFSESAPLVPQRKETREKAERALKALGKWALTNLLLILTIASVIVGVIVGASVREANPSRVAIELIAFPGEIFLRMLQMLILPLIIFSLIAGLGSLDTKVAGALGRRTVIYYGLTTMLAIALGLLLVITIRPGGRHAIEKTCDNSSSAVNNVEQLDTLDSILDLMRNMFPDNLFEATFSQAQTYYADETVTNWDDCVNDYFSNATATFNVTSLNCSYAEQLVDDYNLTCDNATRVESHMTVGSRDGMNILGIIVFTIAFSIVLSRLGTEGQKIVHAVGILNEAIMKLVTIVMWYSPIGIASIIAGKLLEVESYAALVQDVGLYFATVLVGLTIHGALILPLIYFLLTRKNPLKLVYAVLQALLTAFGTSSSSATLPVTIQCLEEKFGADPRVTRFMLPVGATINMDGTALYEAVAAVFIAQVNGVATSFAKIIIISITATAASVGAAGVPQAGLFTLVIVLVAVGLPPEDAALIITVDWLLDRFRTTVNVLGDSFGVGVVQHLSRKDLGHASASPRNLNAANGNGVTMDLKPPDSTDASEGSTPPCDTTDYGSASLPPPPSHVSTPQWSLSTQESAEKPQVYMSPAEIPTGSGDSSSQQQQQQGSANDEESAL